MELPAPAPLIYKIAIYLQDHPDQDGLSIVPGSHKDKDASRAPLHLSTHAGDIVIFDQRLRHAGHFPSRVERVIATVAWKLHRLRLVDDVERHRLFWRLRQLLYGRPGADRLAIFLTFGSKEER